MKNEIKEKIVGTRTSHRHRVKRKIKTEKKKLYFIFIWNYCTGVCGVVARGPLKTYISDCVLLQQRQLCAYTLPFYVFGGMRTIKK